MKTKKEQYQEYLNNGGTMTIIEWENDGRHDKSLESPEWQAYYIDLEAHKERCRREKPAPVPLYFTHYKPTPNWPEHAETVEVAQRLYKQAMSEWEMMCFCSAPNEPGYVKANND